MPSVQLRRRCRELVIEAAARHKVAPGLITAHVRQNAANQARKEVMLQMLEMGLSRADVAAAFGRDLRRVRASVIGKPRCNRRDYTQVDLFGNPLEPVARHRAARKSSLAEAYQLIKNLAGRNPEARDWLRRHARLGATCQRSIL